MIKIINSKTIKIILSIFLIITSIGVLTLMLASGHDIDLEEFENLKVIGAVIFFFLSGLLLFFYKKNSKPLFKYLNVIFLSLSVVSLLYVLYEISKVKLDEFSALFPILFLMIVLFLSVVLLIKMIKNKF